MIFFKFYYPFNGIIVNRPFGSPPFGFANSSHLSKLLLMFMIFSSLNASAIFKEQPINLNLKEVSLLTVFEEIKKQSGYGFWYDKADIDLSTKVSISSKGETLKSALDKLFKDLPYTYEIFDKTISIKRKPRQLSTPIKNKDILVKGKVTDEKNQPLEGVSVRVKGTDRVVATNNQGEFSLEVPLQTSILQFSMLGYTPQEQAIPANNIFLIKLNEDLANLQEVTIVSTGYQNLPKERVTGSFTQPNQQLLNSRITPDIVSRLEGITSGLVFNRNTQSTRAGNTDLAIRGRSTIYANDQPLIVVDNFPFEGDLSAINPNDVENVTILKDAAAASIWGVRAGNGVIIITTKRGSKKEHLNITHNSNFTLFEKPNLFYNYNYLPSSAFIELETFLFNNGRYDTQINDKTNYPILSPVVEILNRQRLGLSSTEAQFQINQLRKNDVRDEELRYFYRNQKSQQHSISLSGGNEKVSYYFSGGLDRTISTLVSNGNNRATINSQNLYKPVKGLELSIGINYAQTFSESDNTLGATAAGNTFVPYQTFKDNDGNNITFDRDYRQSFKIAALERGFLDWSYNPLNELGTSPTKLQISQLRVSGGLKYSFMKGLDLEVKYQLLKSENQVETYNGIETYYARNLINQYSILSNDRVTGYNVPKGGVLYLGGGNGISNQLRTQINYNTEIRNHAFNSIIGYEISEFVSESSDITYYGHNKELGTSLPVNSVSTFNLNPAGLGTLSTNNGIIGKTDRLRSVFANSAYTYQKKYVISASARIDGSNYFGVKTNQKYVPLWSLGSLWHLDQEDFYKINWLPKLKLRISYGYNGNLDRSNTGITTFRYLLGGAQFTNLTYANIINIGNPELRWEKIGIANIGLDFGFKGQRISGSLEYYHKMGEDILGDKPFAASTGISTLRGNYSDMKANGIDISLSSKNIDGKFKWNSGLILSAVRDRVTRYQVIDPNSINYVSGNNNSKPVVGKPVYGIYSYEFVGLDPGNGDPIGMLNGTVSKDYNAIINTTSLNDLVYSGSARPIIFGGLFNSFSYKNLNISLNISYKIGYYFRRPTVNYFNIYRSSLSTNMNSDYLKRWKTPGDENITSIPSMPEYNVTVHRDNFYRSSTATVSKADHIRIQDIILSYSWDRLNWIRNPFKSIQAFLQINNVGLLWTANRDNIDPDVIPNNGNRLINPTPKSFSLGIKTNF